MAEVHVNGRRLLQRLEALARIGANEQGGIDRQLASAADVEARAWLQRCWSSELGLSVRLDAVANLWGEGAEGTEPERKPILLGSHHDTVPNGGRYDGALGVLMATEVLQTLCEAGGTAAAVSCITGIYREHITVTGEANHAGTTLYKDRRDALAAASEVVLAVESLIREPKLSGVAATVGHIEVFPNASNIVSGRVTMSLDLRTADPALRQQALAKFGAAIDEIAARRQLRITRTLDLDQAEMAMAPVVRDALHDACVAAGERDQTLVSMAGHDAANMARLGPAGMLFVASVGGYSHCPQEFSKDEDVVKGAEIFLQALLLLDRRLDA